MLIHLIRWFHAIEWRGLFKEIMIMGIIFMGLQFFLPRSVVQGSSMEPNLYTGNRLAASPIEYFFHAPERGDIVMLHPVEENGPALVKRIIGVPGDVVEFREQVLYINGIAQDEPYVKAPCRAYKCPNMYRELGEDDYFIMGDNRNTSYDSRDYGTVSRTHIMAKVFLRWWPIPEIGGLK